MPNLAFTSQIQPLVDDIAEALSLQEQPLIFGRNTELAEKSPPADVDQRSFEHGAARFHVGNREAHSRSLKGFPLVRSLVRSEYDGGKREDEKIVVDCFDFRLEVVAALVPIEGKVRRLPRFEVSAALPAF